MVLQALKLPARHVHRQAPDVLPATKSAFCGSTSAGHAMQTVPSSRYPALQAHAHVTALPLGTQTEFAGLPEQVVQDPREAPVHPVLELPTGQVGHCVVAV